MTNLSQIKNSHLVRGFQLEAVEWLEKKNGVGMLNCDMGVGKTLIALIYITVNNLKTLVVAPNSVKWVWAGEISKWTNKTYTIISSKDKSIDFSKDITIIS